MVHTSTLEKAHNKDLGYFDPYYEKYKGLIVHIAKSYRQYYVNGTQNVDPDDLIQEATIGFYKAFLAYDSTKNASLKTYSTKYMRGTIQHFLRDKVHTIRKPRLYD